MRVLIDSSAWIEFLNDQHSPVANAVQDALSEQSDHDAVTCGVIVAEVLQGIRRPADYARLVRVFRDLSFLEAEGIDLHIRAASVYRELRQRGVTVRSTIDCLIAVLADEHACALLARDRDLTAILASQLLKVPDFLAVN